MWIPVGYQLDTVGSKLDTAPCSPRWRAQQGPSVPGPHPPDHRPERGYQLDTVGSNWYPAKTVRIKAPSRALGEPPLPPRKNCCSAHETLRRPGIRLEGLVSHPYPPGIQLGWWAAKPPGERREPAPGSPVEIRWSVSTYWLYI
jgi:hypothetical protein